MKERKVEQLAAKYHRLTFAIQTQTDSSKDCDKKRTQLSKTKNDLEVAVGTVIDKGEHVQFRKFQSHNVFTTTRIA